MYFIIYDMSRGIVNHRPYSHKKRRQSFKKKLNRYGISIPEINISPKIKNIISWTLVFVLVIVCGVIFLIRALFF